MSAILSVAYRVMAIQNKTTPITLQIEDVSRDEDEEAPGV
jgi:hypothetical protein